MSDGNDKWIFLAPALAVALLLAVGIAGQIGCLKVLEHETMRSNEAIRRGYFE